MRILKRYTLYAFLAAAAVVAVFPFLWLLSTSFKGAEELFAFPPTLIPAHFIFENYSGVWNAVPFSTYTINSVIIAVVSIVLNVLLSSLAGFALARWNFRYRELFFVLVLGAMMIPKEVIIIPLYTTVLKMKMADTLAGVILPFAVEGFAIFMMRQAFLSIPKEIEEAGIIDGASPLRLWWSVMVPMTRPTIATLIIFTFIGTWGDFLWPLVVLKSSEHFTLQVGLSYMTGTFVDNYRYVAAGAVLAVIPVLVVFLLMQKHFERGLFAGSTK
ncbi:MAG: carbohydrate ABC transporter permease [Ignavibacteriales bacterium]|nr:carbohydrate ABC transporter permease [Ignavibacteriales bacterium]